MTLPDTEHFGGRTRVFGEWVQIVIGLFVFAFGVHCTIRANIGLAPWDCFAMGLSYHTPLNYGLAMTGIAVIILFVDLLLRERIGFGTVIDALLTGNFTEWFNRHSPVPACESVLSGAALMCVGLAIMALGQVIYMRAAQCCGPRDSLLVGLGKRVKKVPIGAVSISIEAAVLFSGWLMGGPIGVGTIISTFGYGVFMQAVFGLVRFEPRDVVHKDIAATCALLTGKSA